MVVSNKHAYRDRLKIRSSKVTILLPAALILCCGVTVYPFYYVFLCSISAPAEVLKMSISFYPKGFSLNSYAMLVNDQDMWLAFMNSFIYITAGTIINCITALLGAYPLSVKHMIHRKWVVRYLLVAMYFSGGIIPAYLLISNLGLYNTRWAAIIPGAVSIWNIMIVRAFFSGIPDSLRDSAQMDGANHFRIMWNIYLPLSKSIMAVIAIYSIVGIWNGWFFSLLYHPSTELHPLQMYLFRVLIQQTVDLSKLSFIEMKSAREKMIANAQLKYSMIIFTTAPIILTYPFFQKFFIKGVMLGSLKE